MLTTRGTGASRGPRGCRAPVVVMAGKMSEPAPTIAGFRAALMLTRVDQEALTAGILILNWNGCELLREHLPSVVAAAEHSGIPIAVADNGSTDGSVSFLASDYPEISTIRLGENHGFSRGYNLAMRDVPWDLVIFLNNDMAVEKDFADHLLEPFRHDGSLLAVSAQILLYDSSARRDETGRTSVRFRRGELWFAHFPVASDGSIVPVFWLGGGSSAVSRSKFEELGGFEELYSPFYFEDVDLSFRGWQRGWPTVLAPRSKVIHKHRASTSRLDPQYVETIFARNRLLFLWLNIRSRRLLLQHVARLAFLAVRRPSGSTLNYCALLGAVRCLPSIRRRRRRDLPAIVFRDTEILSFFSQDQEWSA